MKFRALRVHRDQSKKVTHQLEDIELSDLGPGDVVVEVHYSSLNYKDALGATGTAPIQSRFPLVVGIDLAGIVELSDHPNFKPGDAVLANGCNLGEKLDGGYAEKARVNGDTLIPLPKGLTLQQAMGIGTAGFTAALCLERMLTNRQNPSLGPIVVTGATGGVGSIATHLFSTQGYEVIAVTGRPEHTDYLKELGASRVSTLDELELASTPLAAAKFGGVVDNLGGEPLAKLLPHVQLWGNVACVGLASDSAFSTTVMPLILRGVSLLGISSNNCTMELRRILWNRLGAKWQLPKLTQMISRTVPLSEISPVFSEILGRQCHGRIVVDCRL